MRKEKIKRCDECKHFNEDGSLCAHPRLRDKPMPTWEQRGSYMLIDCGPEGHRWEAK